MESTSNINDAFHPGTTNKRTAQWWFQKFRFRESFEYDEHNRQSTNIDNGRVDCVL